MEQSMFVQTVIGVFLLLVVSSTIAWLLKLRVKTDNGRVVVDNLIARINAWWVMAVVLGAAFYAGRLTTVALFFVLSCFALREFLRLIGMHAADQRLAMLAFVVLTPLQYWLIYDGWYGLFAILIPVYAFLVLPFLSALAGDTDDFLARTAKMQWALMLCVYCVSYLPALLMLPFKNTFSGLNVQLVVYFVLVVQLSDVLQYVFGKVFGKHALVPKVSPNKTWEGLIGGASSAVLLAVFLRGLTPFNAWQAALIGLVLVLAGFAGGLCLSAIKRDRGVKDFGSLIKGHGGVLDRMDSICFAAPVFFHICRYWFLKS
jgi:phosphatidate cytidylyltransferase